MTFALSTLFDGSSNWNVLDVIVVGSIASLKVAVTAVIVLTPVAPFDGVNVATAGTGGGSVVTKTTSTQ